LIKLDPKLAVHSLSEVKPGSLVWHSETMGFCCIHPSDPQKTHFMVGYLPELGIFRLLNPGPVSVIDFGNDLIIVPKIQSIAQNISVGVDATTELFFHGGSHKIVVQVPNSVVIRFLDVNAGTTGSDGQGESLTAFREWTLGVSTTVGGFLPLMLVGPRGPSAPFSEDAPVAPDEV
jgi:hypothetical protein